jgi:uncharacterized protein (TIGR00251 family)
VIDWQAPGNELRDNPVVRQAPPGRVKAGEERRHATGDPSLLMPGDILTRRFFKSFINFSCTYSYFQITMVRTTSQPILSFLNDTNTFSAGVFMEDISGALKTTQAGTLITIEVTTGSRQNLFPSGYNSWRKAIGCQVTAPPVEGKANLAILDLIADTFSVPKTKVHLISGVTSSQKKILISGVAFDEVLSKVEMRMPS